MDHNHDHMMMNSTTTMNPHDHHNHDHMMMNSTTTMNPHHNHSQMTTNHNHDDMNHDSHSSHTMMMVMHAGFKEIIVFPGWKTESIGNLVGSCIALVLIAMAYEALKLFRDKITANNIRKRKKIHIQQETNSNNKIENFKIQENFVHNQSYLNRLFSLEHLIQTLLHVFQFTISYFLMLAFMTYNYWLCLSILIGIGIGFFLFGVRRDKIDLNEDCH